MLPFTASVQHRACPLGWDSMGYKADARVKGAALQTSARTPKDPVKQGKLDHCMRTDTNNTQLHNERPTQGTNSQEDRTPVGVLARSARKAAHDTPHPTGKIKHLNVCMHALTHRTQDLERPGLLQFACPSLSSLLFSISLALLLLCLSDLMPIPLSACPAHACLRGLPQPVHPLHGRGTLSCPAEPH